MVRAFSISVARVVVEVYTVCKAPLAPLSPLLGSPVRFGVFLDVSYRLPPLRPPPLLSVLLDGDGAAGWQVVALARASSC